MPISVLAILGVGVVDPSTPIVCADDVGLTRGDGCFEGCRIRGARGGSQVDDLDAHMERMAASAASLGIAFETRDWKILVDEVVRTWERTCPDENEAGLKLVLTRGREGVEGQPTGYASVAPLPPAVLSARRHGLAVATMDRGMPFDAFASRPWLLGGVKTLSYAINMAAQREARQRGADEALFVSSDGRLLEGPTSSVVWLDGMTMCTVACGASGILRSITTERLIERAGGEGYDVRVDSGTVEDLQHADLVMLVSSSRGPVRVSRLDGVALPDTDTGRRALEISRRLTGFDDG